MRLQLCACMKSSVLCVSRDLLQQYHLKNVVSTIGLVVCYAKSEYILIMDTMQLWTPKPMDMLSAKSGTIYHLVNYIVVMFSNYS